MSDSLRTGVLLGAGVALGNIACLHHRSSASFLTHTPTGGVVVRAELTTSHLLRDPSERYARNEMLRSQAYC